MMNNLGNTNAVILKRSTNSDEINSTHVLAIQKVSANTATRSQTPKNGIAAHKPANLNKVNKPQHKRPSYMANDTARRMQEVIDRRTQEQRVTIKSINTNNKDKTMKDSTNTMTGGLFHKLEDINAPLTNSPKVSTTNFLITLPTDSTNLKRMQERTNLVDNNKDAKEDADNINQKGPKLRCCTDVQQKTVVFGKVGSLLKGKIDKNTVYKDSKETIPINMAKGKDRFKVTELLDFSVTILIW